MPKSREPEQVYQKGKITITIERQAFTSWRAVVHAITPLHPEGRVVHKQFASTRFWAKHIAKRWGDCWLDQRCEICEGKVTLDEEVDTVEHARCIQTYQIQQVFGCMSMHD